MNKKIVSVLTALLIVTMAVPVFADGHMEDNVKITGEVKSVINVGKYGDSDLGAAELWADDDVLDEDYTADPDLFPAQKAFYQEIGFDVAGTVNQNINFNLAIDTLTNNFTKVTGPGNTNGTTLGDPGALDELVMDNALLTIADDVSTLKIGDINGFHAATYFMDDEDLEGMELTTAMNGADLRTFVGSNTGDFPGTDYYGASYTKNYENGYLAGKLYGARNNDEFIHNLAVAAKRDMSEALTVDGELVVNDADKNMARNATGKEGDILVTANADYTVSETVTVNGTFEMAGEDFAPVKTHDLEEAGNYNLFSIGSDVVLDENNTMNAAYTMVDHDKSENKSTLELGLENVNGAYTNNASIAFTTNDTYTDNSDITVINLGTEYAMDAATLSAGLTNQSSDYHNEFTYLAVGYDQTITDNVTWNSEFGYIDGTTGDAGTIDDDLSNIKRNNLANTDSSGVHLETALTVSF